MIPFDILIPVLYYPMSPAMTPFLRIRCRKIDIPSWPVSCSNMPLISIRNKPHTGFLGILRQILALPPLELSLRIQDGIVSVVHVVSQILVSDLLSLSGEICIPDEMRETCFVS